MESGSENIILTPIKEDDIFSVHTLNSYPEVARYNTVGIPKDYDATLELHRPMLIGEETKGWVIRLKDENEFIGILGLRLAPKRFLSGEIYYSLLPAFWGKGCTSEAVRLFLNYAFNELELHRIEAGCAIDNIGSIKVLEKCGFTKEGRKRKVLPLKTGWTDNFEYAILREDWAENT